MHKGSDIEMIINHKLVWFEQKQQQQKQQTTTTTKHNLSDCFVLSL